MGMNILQIVNKVKEKIISKSILNKKNITKIRLIDFPLFSLSAFACGMSIFFSSAFLLIGTNSIALTLVNALMLSYAGFNYSVYRKGAKKTLQDIKDENYSELIRNIDLRSISSGNIDVSPEKNNEFINVMNMIYITDLNKEIMEDLYSSLFNETDMTEIEVQYLLNSQELIFLQKEKGISSAAYIYALALKVEEFYRNKRLTEEEMSLVIPKGLDIKEQHEQLYILSLIKNKKEKILLLNNTEIDNDKFNYVNIKKNVHEKVKIKEKV